MQKLPLCAPCLTELLECEVAVTKILFVVIVLKIKDRTTTAKKLKAFLVML